MEDGPTLIYAEIVPESQWDLGKDQSTGRRFGAPGDGCPESTQQVLRVVWTGGITKPGGGEIDDVERIAYRVLIEDDAGELTRFHPSQWLTCVMAITTMSSVSIRPLILCVSSFPRA